MTLSPAIARLVANFNAFNAINVQTVVIHLQKYPGKPSIDAGIADVEFKVLSNGVVTQSGRSAKNGKIDVRAMPGARACIL